MKTEEINTVRTARRIDGIRFSGQVWQQTVQHSELLLI